MQGPDVPMCNCCQHRGSPHLQLFDFYLKKIVIDKDLDTSSLAQATVGLTGADIANLVNQAALKAATGTKEIVSLEDLESALDDTVLGMKQKVRKGGGWVGEGLF